MKQSSEASGCRMTGSADKLMELFASEFIVSTCQSLPKSYDPVTDRLRCPIPSVCLGPINHSWFCGSSAEFYIRPLNSCIDDTDKLYSSVNKMAFTEDIAVLPEHVNYLADTFQCYKIDPHPSYPSFVRLRHLGEMNYNWKNKQYEFCTTHFQNKRITLEMTAADPSSDLLDMGLNMMSLSVKGPAIMTTHWDFNSATCDYVPSMWCPQWPKDAQDFLRRSRDHGWPTSDTISDVVQHGCHVVYVQHRDCRNYKTQWRFSFSVAEVILLQSWTQNQQIVYHLLRFFCKKEFIKKDCPKEDEVLCTYHLKTLMLWTCEEMPPEWWNTSSVISICCKLLRRLSEWLETGYCPNYFIPEANLFHASASSEILDKIQRRLNEFRSSGFLCAWFVKNYIWPFFLTNCRVENEIEATPNLDIASCMRSLLGFRKTHESESFDVLFSLGFIHSCYHFCFFLKDAAIMHPIAFSSFALYKRNVGLLSHNLMAMLPIPEKVWCFKYLDLTMLSLNAACGIGCGRISWVSDYFAEYVRGITSHLKTVSCQYHNFPKPYTAERSHFQLLQAEEFMENLSMSKSCSEFQLVWLMSQELLRKSLVCDDSQSDSIAPVALTYLAALYFAKSVNQIVIDLCSMVLMGQTTHATNETLNACCLLFIDDVARIVGFYLRCKKFNPKENKKQISLDFRLTPKIFAYYLYVTSAERIFNKLELNPDLPTAIFPLDVLLLILAKRKVCTLMKSNICSNVSRTNSLIKGLISKGNRFRVKEEEIIDALMKYALENMASLYSTIGIQCTTVDCYRALYFYKCRQYAETLHLCERILEEPDIQSDSNEIAFANVLLLSPFDSFFDEDVQSLLGFHSLFCNLSLPHENRPMRKFQLTAHLLSRFFYTPPYFLDCTWSIKCHYFLSRHFLARYLRIRCYIDCPDSHTDLLAEFDKFDLRSKHPFEHIIHLFLSRKLHI